MPDNELRVTITAESSGLTAGLADATSQVQSAAGSMASATDTAAVATRNLEQAQTQLAGAIAAGNASAIAIVAEYQRVATAANAAAAATQNLGAQQARTFTAAPGLRWSQSMDQAANATTNLGVSARQAATSSIGMLEGRMMSANRSAAAFLSTTLGLGPVLQAAFPIIGAAALIEVLIDIGSEIVKVVGEISKLADTFNTGWIETAVGKLMGMGTAFDKLAKDIQTAQNATDAGISKQKELGLDIIGLQQGKAAEDSARISLLQQQNAAIRFQIDMLKERSTIEHGVAGGSLSSGVQAFQQGLPNRLFSPDAKANAAAADAEIVKMTTDLATNSAEMQKLALQAEATEEHVHKALKPPKDNTLRDFVQESIADFHRMEEESDKINAAITAAFDQSQKADEEAARRADEIHKQSVEEWKKGQQEEIAGVREATQAAIQKANFDFETAQMRIKQEEDLGVISHRVATQQLLDAEALRDKTTQGALKNEQGLFNPAYGQQEANEYKKLENQMTAEAQKAALERQRIEQQETQQFIRLWKSATNAFNSDFTTALNAWATHQQTAGKAFGEMLGTMEKQVMDFTAKTILEHAEMWAELKILQALGLAEKKGQDSTANAAAIVGDAGVAAAGTMAYYSAINPPIAPAMASLQYGLTMAYGAASAFEAGGVVAGGHGMPVPIIAHAGERVLSADQTANFHSLVNSGGNRAATLNQTNHFGGGIDDDMMDRHTNRTIAKLRGMLRPEVFR